MRVIIDGIAGDITRNKNTSDLKIISRIILQFYKDVKHVIGNECCKNMNLYSTGLNSLLSILGMETKDNTFEFVMYGLDCRCFLDWLGKTVTIHNRRNTKYKINHNDYELVFSSIKEIANAYILNIFIKLDRDKQIKLYISKDKINIHTIELLNTKIYFSDDKCEGCINISEYESSEIYNLINNEEIGIRFLDEKKDAYKTAQCFNDIEYLLNVNIKIQSVSEEKCDICEEKSPKIIYECGHGGCMTCYINDEKCCEEERKVKKYKQEKNTIELNTRKVFNALEMKKLNIKYKNINNNSSNSIIKLLKQNKIDNYQVGEYEKCNYDE